MSLLPFPADSAEFEEFLAVTGEIAREIEESTPDPEPVHSDARFTDAEIYPQSQYGGDGPWNWDEQSEELRDREEADYWKNLHEREDEDRYLDSYWESQGEHGMDGCCGDF